MAGSSDLVGLLLPGGVTAILVLFVNGMRAYFDSRSRKEETVLKRWQNIADRQDTDRAEVEEERDYYKELAEYWRGRCGDHEYLMRGSGMTVPPAEPPLRAKAKKESRS